MNHRAHAFVGKELVDQDALTPTIEHMHPRHASETGFGGGPQQHRAHFVRVGHQTLGLGRTDRMRGLTVDENGLFEQRDDLCHSDAFGEIHHRVIQRANR